MIPEGTSVTLVGPRYPVNLGHVARLVRNFGVKRLYLVDPQVDISAAAVYASHAADVLDRAEVTTFRDVRERHQLLVATTAVRATRRSNVVRRMVRPEAVRGLAAAAGSCSLVFGRDTTGLTNEEIALCDATCTIDTAPSYRALNLGHAVAIMLYVVSRPQARKPARQSRVARTVFAQKLHDLAAAAQLQPHRVRNLQEEGKRMAAASGLSDRDLATLSGVLARAAQRLGEGQAGDSKE